MYRICIDVGGTFTDCLVLDEDRGELYPFKSPTTPPDTNSNGIPDDCEGGPCTYNANIDDAIDVIDLLGLLALWGPCPSPCTPGVPNAPDDCFADGNRDCVVDVLDLLGLLAAWGPCP